MIINQKKLSKHHIILTGASGMLASHFVVSLRDSGAKLMSVYHENPTPFGFANNIQCDISDANQVMALASFGPTLIIHAAALTNMTTCELQPGKANLINVVGSANMAQLAKSTGAKLVYISTDAVFEGRDAPYFETDSPNATTVYGKTKHKGELESLKRCPDALIIRSTLFGSNFVTDKKSFIQNVLSKLRNEQDVFGFEDVVFGPVYVGRLIDCIGKLIAVDASGIFNIVSDAPLSKFEFCQKIGRLYGYDGSLIKANKVDSVYTDLAYPKKLHLSNHKVRAHLKIKGLLLDDMLRTYKQVEQGSTDTHSTT
jgi:dTDP-4-dehydrorhamnose reductase